MQWNHHNASMWEVDGCRGNAHPLHGVKLNTRSYIGWPRGEFSKDMTSRFLHWVCAHPALLLQPRDWDSFSMATPLFPGHTRGLNSLSISLPQNWLAQALVKGKIDFVIPTKEEQTEASRSQMT